MKQPNDSLYSYGGVEQYHAPVMGVGQGNQTGPQVWTVISSSMFEVLRQKGFSTKFNTPITKQTLELCGFAYVDDTDLLQSSGTKSFYNNPEQDMERMQNAIDCWESVAKSTGGAITTNKSLWYCIYFE